jgi:transcriptional regulator with XRE-family HTH domain
LAVFVHERLTELGVRQSEFCRLNTFDQGLLSKIQNSIVTSLSLESVLRLAIGLSVSPRQIFNLIERPDLNELVLQAYSLELPEQIGNRLQERHQDLASDAQRIVAEAMTAMRLDNGQLNNHSNDAYCTEEAGLMQGSR